MPRQITFTFEPGIRTPELDELLKELVRKARAAHIADRGLAASVSLGLAGRGLVIEDRSGGHEDPVQLGPVQLMVRRRRRAIERILPGRAVYLEVDRPVPSIDRLEGAIGIATLNAQHAGVSDHDYLKTANAAVATQGVRLRILLADENEILLGLEPVQ